MKVICFGCKQEFECSLRKFNFNTKRNINLYCSKECFNICKTKKHSIKTKCSTCGKSVTKSKSHLNKSKTGNIYCSRSCSATKNNTLFRKWKNHPKYKDGSNCYRNFKLQFSSDHKCERCGFNNILALDVHHKDSDRSNNNLDNLELLCCNCHAIEHRTKLASSSLSSLIG